MDEMTMLRDAGQDVPPPTDAALRAGRDRLAKAAAAARRPRVGLRLVGLTGLAAAAAGVIAVGLTVAQDVTPGGTPQANAASMLLRAAASAARRETDTRAGKLLYVRTLKGGPEGGAQCEEVWFHPDGTPEAATGWSGKVPKRWNAKDLAHVCDRPMAGPGRLGGPTSVPTDRRDHPDARYLPTDPGALRARLYSDAAHGRGQFPGEPKRQRDEAVFTRVYRLAQIPIPSKLRAALYEVLATVPGVGLVPDARDALGRRGVAVSWSKHEDWGDDRVEIILDAKTYRYLGSRYVTMPKGSSPQLFPSALLLTGIVDKPFQRP